MVPCLSNESLFQQNLNLTADELVMEKLCHLKHIYVPLLLAIYLFFGNILLINMLIAIFA